jgi:hypothetical protein
MGQVLAGLQSALEGRYVVERERDHGVMATVYPAQAVRPPAPARAQLPLVPFSNRQICPVFGRVLKFDPPQLCVTHFAQNPKPNGRQAA